VKALRAFMFFLPALAFERGGNPGDAILYPIAEG
jgi:hypothetical protein